MSPGHNILDIDDVLLLRKLLEEKIYSMIKAAQQSETPRHRLFSLNTEQKMPMKETKETLIKFILVNDKLKELQNPWLWG